MDLDNDHRLRNLGGYGLRDQVISKLMIVPDRTLKPLLLKPDSLLYRGVNIKLHDCGKGLTPRDHAKRFERVVSYDGTWRYDENVIYGDSHSQAVHAHQFDSENFAGPALSFTTSQAVARKFATFDEFEDGVIYAVTVAALKEYGCSLEDPRLHTKALQDPGEKEIIVVLPAGIPELPLDMFQLIDANLAN